MPSHRRSRRWHGLVAAAAVTLPVTLAATAAATSPPASAATPAPAGAATSAGSPTLRFWTATQIGSMKVNSAAIPGIARDFTYISGPGLHGFWQRLAAANPALRQIAYMNGALQPSATRFPASAYLYDSHGRKVLSHYHNYLMNAASPVWRAFVIGECRAAIAAHYTGCYLDTMGIAPLSASYDLTGAPVDPATHRSFTTAQYLQTTSGLAAAVQQAVGRAPVVPNGLNSGAEYFGSPSSLLLRGTTAGVAETWLRGATDSVNAWPAPSSWLLDVREIAAADAARKGALVIVKIWTRASAAQVSQWHDFGLATLLLGAGGYSAYDFLGSQNANVLAPDAYVGFPLGGPTAGFSVHGGVYTRPFSNGEVLVNPGGAPARAAVAGSLVSIRGQRYSGTVTVPAHTGLILHR